jgi:ATP:ADP antiporter, AAA family
MSKKVAQTWQPFFRRVFDIRTGETSRALLMQLLIFLIITTLLIVKPTANALFISELGIDQLPIVFLLVALIAVWVIRRYTKVLLRSTLAQIMQGTLALSALLLISFGIMLRLNLLSGGILYIFYVFVALFGLLTASQFWILANMVFNAREARRLFGFIGSGAIGGGIFGGYLTSWLAPVLGSENLLFCAAILLIGCLPIVSWVWRRHVTEYQNEPHRERAKQAAPPANSPWKLVRHSAHLSYLAAITGVSVLVAKLVDYQFSAVAAARIDDPDALAAFFGFWLSNLNVVSLIVQLFVTRQVMRSLGVGRALFFLPAGILVGSLLVLLTPQLWSAIILKINDGSLKQSINKASMELLALPIPRAIKNQTKTFIDVTIDSLATGLGGLILLIVASLLNVPIRYISLITVLLIGFWGYFAWKVRGEYLKTFKQQMAQAAPTEKSNNGLELGDTSVLKGLERVLWSGKDKQRIFVLKQLLEVKDLRFLEPVAALILHPNPEIRLGALKWLYLIPGEDLVKQVHPLIHDPDQRVKVIAFEYLILHDPAMAPARMHDFLHHEDPDVRGAALVGLSEETLGNASLRTTYSLEKHLRDWQQETARLTDPAIVFFYRKVFLMAIGRARYSPYYPVITEGLNDPDTNLVREACRSAGYVLYQPHQVHLLALLNNPEVRPAAISALSLFGRSLLPAIRQKAMDTDTPIDVLRALPMVAETIPDQDSVQLLFEWLDSEDAVVRLESLRALNTLRINAPRLQFEAKDLYPRILREAKLYQNTLAALYTQTISSANNPPAIQEARQALIIVLERRLDHNLERIFRLLGLRYDPEDIIPIYRNIQGQKPDMRLNALEFLDNLLEPNLKRILIPIIESAILETLSEEAIRRLNGKIPSEEACLVQLLNGRDIRTKLAVIYLMTHLKAPAYKKALNRLPANAHSKVLAAAKKALSQWANE